VRFPSLFRSLSSPVLLLLLLLLLLIAVVFVEHRIGEAVTANLQLVCASSWAVDVLLLAHMLMLRFVAARCVGFSVILVTLCFLSPFLLILILHFS
jgi:hypothetical protein